MDRVITVEYKMGHYEIYVNGDFEASCDPDELDETLKEVCRKYEQN